jgi:BirA family biotin operon repressor/biotin-[acetyl-CoA-carboxylase] ligase
VPPASRLFSPRVLKIEPKAITKLINKRRSEITTLVNQNQNADPVLFLQAFLFELERLYNKLMANNVKEIKNEWEKRSSTLGKNISVSTPSGQVKGRAISLDDDGALLISQRGKMQRLLVGDVSYRTGR